MQEVLNPWHSSQGGSFHSRATAVSIASTIISPCRRTPPLCTSAGRWLPSRPVTSRNTGVERGKRIHNRSQAELFPFSFVAQYICACHVVVDRTCACVVCRFLNIPCWVQVHGYCWHIVPHRIDLPGVRQKHSGTALLGSCLLGYW